MNHIENIARRKLSVSEEWQSCVWKRVGDTNDCIVSLSIPHIITRGKNKGKKRWPGPTRDAVVTQVEIQAEIKRYELETDNCGQCYGEGRTWVGWGKDTGDRYKICAKCHGSGSASREKAGA